MLDDVLSRDNGELRVAVAAAIGAPHNSDRVDSACKSAMWVFRSGVNGRRHLVGGGAPTDPRGDSDEQLRRAWALLEGPVRAWCANYVRRFA